MKLVRKIHFWLGSFFAPAIIFFSLSGAFQILGLHEGDGAVGWIARMAQVHKSQTIAAPRARSPKPAAAAPAADATHADAAHADAPTGPRPDAGGSSRSTPLVAFFLLMALSLITSSCLGVFMAFQYKRDRRVIIGLLVAGTVLPIAFLWM